MTVFRSGRFPGGFSLFAPPLHPLTLAAALSLLFLAAACSPDRGATPEPDDTVRPASLAGTPASASTSETPTATLPIEAVLRDLDLGTATTGDPMDSLYARASYQPFWVTQDGFTDRVTVFLEDLAAAERQGLHPPVYNLDALQRVVHEAGADAPPRTLAEIDVRFTEAFLTYADDLLAGRVAPEQLASEVYMNVPTPDLAAVAQDLLTGDARQSFADALAPDHPEYSRLLDARDAYADFVADGGWAALPDEIVLEVGDTSPHVPAVRERLAITGDWSDPSHQDSLYNAALAGAVHRFQQRHGLKADSIVGPSTLAAMNVSATERLRQIDLTLERWRWLPTDLGERHILVNIPRFEVYGYEDGREALRMDVVVGAEYDGRETPVFSDSMNHVIFRPYWNIPDEIAAEEILPSVANDLSYLERNGYEIVPRFAPDAEVVAPSEMEIAAMPENGYHLRQRPGPTNALGLVKYMFPNRWGIYLHDTPADHLFDDPKRSYSHGCIRLEDPPRFGAFVLGDKGWSAADVRQAMQDGDRRRVNLDEAIPVYIMYLTASVAEDGTVQFSRDLYGFDDALADLLTTDYGDRTSAVASVREAVQTLDRQL